MFESEIKGDASIENQGLRQFVVPHSKLSSIMSDLGVSTVSTRIKISLCVVLGIINFGGPRRRD
jgi:hypothetical protein